MATIAVGDIHGNLLALEDLLEKVLAELSQEDVLVFLGDYIDRGPESRGCVERIIELKEEAAFRVVTLLGNHEDWMLRTLKDHSSHSWLLGMESFQTIASYSADAAVAMRREAERAGLALVTEKVPLPYEIFFDLMPLRHLTFLQSLELFCRTEDVTCAHSGIDLNGRLEAQNRDVFVWGPDGFPDQYRGKDAVVYGHRDNALKDETGWPQPCVKPNHTYGIDTISKGVLTAMRFPDHKTFQSKLCCLE